jgi:hypothetical protein
VELTDEEAIVLENAASILKRMIEHAWETRKQRSSPDPLSPITLGIMNAYNLIYQLAKRRIV